MKEKHVLRTRGKGQQSQEEEVVMFLASMSLAEQDVFFSWLAGTLDCPCFYHYFSKKPIDSLDAGPGPGAGVCIQEEVVSWVITWK